MEQVPNTKVISAHQLPQDVAKLISKLRWIGTDDEARRLQTAVARLPPRCKRHNVGRTFEH
jgi:hypothetical protein